MMEISKRLIRWTIGVLASVDLILIFLHLVWGERISLINLEEEQNFATWYSSTKLLLIGILSIAAYIIETPELGAKLGLKYQKLWLIMAVIFIGLSADEAATIHERLSRYLMSYDFGHTIRQAVLGGDATKDAFVWVIFLSPLIVASFILFLIFFYTRMRHGKGLYHLIISGSFLFFLSPILEATIYLTPPLARWQEAEIRRYLLLTSIEESAELVGSTLFLIALVFFIQFLLKSRSKAPADG